MKLLAIDPGDTTGWATWDTVKGNLPLNFGNVKADDLFEWVSLQEGSFDVVVVEDYIPRPPKHGGFDHTYAKINTLRYIGAIQYHCYLNGMKFVLQPPSIKPVGAGWGNIPHNKKTHAPHHLDAMKHGFYYLVRNNVIKKEELFAQIKPKSSKVKKATKRVTVKGSKETSS